MNIEIPDAAGPAFQKFLEALGTPAPEPDLEPILVRDAIQQHMRTLGESSRKTYKTHLLRLRDGIAPICDQECEPCSIPVRTQPLDDDGRRRSGRQYVFECRCDCRGCVDSRVSLAPQGPLELGSAVLCRATLAIVSVAAYRIAKKSGNYDNARRARLGKPPKKADGHGAQENAVAALRSLCKAYAAWTNGYDGLDVAKPTRSSDSRRPLEDYEMAELCQVTELGGRDPELDSLLTEFGVACGARRLGAVTLQVRQLDRAQQLIHLRDKYGKTVSQPVAIELIDALLEHAKERGGRRCDPQHPDYDPTSPVFWMWNRHGGHYKAVTSRHFDGLTERWQSELPWAAAERVAYHHLRHTVAERLKSMPGGGQHVAQRYLRHADSNVTDRYGRCTIEKLAECLSTLLGFEHPLVHGRAARREEVERRLGIPPEADALP